MIAVTKLSQLSNRDREILDHIARHRLSVYRVLQPLYFADQGPTAAVKVVTRLCRTGLLKRVKMLRREHCFILTRRSAKVLGHAARQRTSPGPQSLPIDFAALMYASASPKRKRLTPHELKILFPWINRALATLPHCFDQSLSDLPCLELLRADLGGKPDHVARKCEADVRKRQHIPAFQDLLRQGRFRLVVITTTQGKADLIREAIDGHVWPDGLLIHLAVLPQLSSFLGGPRNAAQ